MPTDDEINQIVGEAVRAGLLDWCRGVVVCRTCGERQSANDTGDGCQTCGGDVRSVARPVKRETEVSTDAN